MQCSITYIFIWRHNSYYCLKSMWSVFMNFYSKLYQTSRRTVKMSLPLLYNVSIRSGLYICTIYKSMRDFAPPAWAKLMFLLMARRVDVLLASVCDQLWTFMTSVIYIQLYSVYGINLCTLIMSFVSDRSGGFLLKRRFPPPRKLTVTI